MKRGKQSKSGQYSWVTVHCYSPTSYFSQCYTLVVVANSSIVRCHVTSEVLCISNQRIQCKET